jgi:uncharacterized protein YbjT (DUF2867 family)
MQNAPARLQENLPKPPREKCRLLVVGGTGAVGREVLRLALADERVERVIAPSRRPLAPHPKLENPTPDFAHLPAEAPWWRVDAVICALGTTIKAAGSQQAFAAIDRDLVVEVARLARRAGATRLALNSSLGASPRANFYLRTKAEAEQGIGALDYPTFVVVRPSLIDAKRVERRFAESAALLLAHRLGPLIPRRYRPVAPAAIAAALLDGALSGQPGERCIESEDI